MSVKDNLEMEYEARAMINESQYETLMSFYCKENLPYKDLINTNIYFDTVEKYLTHHHMVLRIRNIKGDKDELTLKIKGEKGDLEITHTLSELEKKEMLEKAIVPSSKISDELISRGVNLSQIKQVASLKTNRREIYFKDFIFVIDKNIFNNKIDFNIEVEAKSKEEAKKHLNELGALVGVSYIKGYISKSKRAILDL